MWIKLDFTPLFLAGFLTGLLLIALGLFLRSTFPKAMTLGLVVAIAGTIPVLLGAFFLIAEPAGKWLDNQRSRTWMETLAADRQIQGLNLPRGTAVEWHGKPAVISRAILAAPLTVLGHAFEGELKFSNTYTGSNTLVSTDLETGTLAATETIDDIPCQAHHEVEFFHTDNSTLSGNANIGRLRRCTPSSDFEFRANLYRAAVEVTFNTLGEVERGVLAADQNVDGHRCKEGTEVERSEQRAIRFTLATDESVGGIACKAGTEVTLERSTGALASAVLAHDQQIEETPCRSGEAVTFAYRDGSYVLDSCILSRATAIAGVLWPADSALAALATDHLQATLPATGLTLGELKIIGRCKLQWRRDPPALEIVQALAGAPAYAELRGQRFSSLNTNPDDGSAWGELSLDGTLVRFPAGTSLNWRPSSLK